MWKNQIAHMIEWIESKGFSYVCKTDEEDRVELSNKTVFINSRIHPEFRFYTLLHECGHIDVHESQEEFISDHPMYVHAHEYDGRIARSRKYKVSLVAEEIEAWKRGRRIAHDERLFIDDKKYDECMSKYIMSYINWVATE